MQQKDDHVDEKVENILTDLGYTKTQPVDSKKRVQSMYNNEIYRRCMAAIFDFGLKEGSPKAIYPSLKRYDLDLKPEHIKSHLQKYRSNSKPNQLEYLHFFEHYMRKEEKVITLVERNKEKKVAASTSSFSTSNPVNNPIPYYPYNQITFLNPEYNPLVVEGNNTSLAIPYHPFYTIDVSNEQYPLQSMSDTCMAYQVAIHDDIISNQAMRQQTGFEETNVDHDLIAPFDYQAFQHYESEAQTAVPYIYTDNENPLCFLKDIDN